MKAIIFTMAFLGVLAMNTEIRAQGRGIGSIPYYNDIAFNGNFGVLLESDEASNYFAVDLRQLPTLFEKTYFKNSIFSVSKLVRIDANNLEIAWFKTHKSFTENEILQLLLSLKTQTLNVSGTMSESQKQEWLTNNKK